MVLAAPTGTFPTGTVRLHLRNPARDPIALSAGRRDVVVQLWYPADGKGDGPAAPYAPPGETAALQKFYPVPSGVFDVHTHSAQAAPVAAGPHPVIFFAHGLCGALTDSTNVAEQLAADGYVVAAVSAVHEDPALELPDGTLLTTSDPAFCQVGADPFSASGQAMLNRLLDARVADIRFTVDRLQDIDAGGDPTIDGSAPPRGLAGAMKLTGMGIYGHSFGGGTAAAVLHSDTRFAAGIDLDGFIIGPTATEGLRQPFLVVGAASHDIRLDPSWSTFLPALSGWHRWLQLQKAGHYRFMDLGGSPRALGLDRTLGRQDPTTWSQVFGDIDDATSQRIVRDLVTGFFDQFLRHRQTALLSNPSATHPEVVDLTDHIAH